MLFRSAEHYKVYLTGKGNFRDDVASILPYKGNRDDLHKPIHYDAIKQYLIDVWDAEVIEGMEADDAMAIAQSDALVWDFDERADRFLPEEGSTVICTIDKDLRMVPGYHYNWNKDEHPVWVSEVEGIKWFYTQLLTGDMTDNIQGIPGVGPKKAEKILEGCETEEEMYDNVWNAYRDYLYPDGVKHPQLLEKVNDMVLENAQLLFMVRELDDEGKPVMWSPPV